MMTIDTQKLDALVMERTIEDLIKHAQAGDAHAAQLLISQLPRILSTQNVDPITGQAAPVPNCIRDYLSNSFARMIGSEQVKSTDVALGLKPKRGAPRLPFQAKWLGGYLVMQGVVEGGLTVEESAAGAADLINGKMERDELTGLWAVLDKKHEYQSFISWYYDVKDELEKLYTEASATD